MKNILLYLSLFAFHYSPFICPAEAQGKQNPVAAHIDDFMVSHPATGCYWEWMNGNISKEGITKDLEYMKAAGIESAFIFDAWVGIGRGPVDYASKEWIDAVRHACKEAQRLGIVLGIHNSPGYTAMGGPWIRPEESMKQLTWSVSSKKNPPVPRHKMGFYRDIKTFRTTCSDEMQDIGRRLEQGESVIIKLQKEKPVIGFNLWRGEREQPLDLFDGPRDYAPRLHVEVSLDCQSWQTLGTASGQALLAHDIPIHFKCNSTPCRFLRLTSNRGTNLDRIEILTASGSGTTYRRVGYTTTGQMVTAASALRPRRQLGSGSTRLDRIARCRLHHNRRGARLPHWWHWPSDQDQAATIHARVRPATQRKTPLLWTPPRRRALWQWRFRS